MEKKTDRRTLYTRQVIKDSFLALIDKGPYERIHVTAICKEAQISRPTFYLHFENVEDVLNQVIDDALFFSTSPSEAVADMVELFSGSEKERAGGQQETLLPA